MTHNILVVSSAREPWGAESSMVRIANALIEAGAQITFLVSSNEVAEFVSSHVEGASVTQVKIAAGAGRIGVLRAFAKACGWLRNKYDVALVFHLDLLPLSAYPGIRRIARAWWADIHDTPGKRLTRLVMAAALTRYTGAIAISQFAQSWTVGARSRVVVPRPIDIPQSVSVRARNRSENLRVAVVGRLNPDKNIELAIRAASHCLPQVELHVYGEATLNDVDYSSSLMRSATEALGDRVKFHGRVDPGQLFREIDVLLVCNGREPSGRTVGEALAHGIPVVVPDSGGACEYVQMSNAGLLYAANDEVALRGAISRIIADPAQVDGWRAKGRVWVSDIHHIKNVARRYAEALGLEEGRIYD
jgi:glycosyltransferase involved in cell wall biosynthesis